MTMTPQELEFLKQQEAEMNNARSAADANNMQSDLQAVSMQENNRTMIYDQLNLDEELLLIENLLRSKVLKADEHGNQKWVIPNNKDMIVLSDEGVHLIMNTITFYMNKNTLLSNYDEDTIMEKMEDFSTALADTVFMKYEKVFKYPTAKECNEKLIKRLRKKLREEVYTAQLREEKVNRNEIWKKLVEEIDATKEREKIKEGIMKEKLKMYELLMRKVQDAVHSTYLRALFGAERRTLRQHIHVSESNGDPMQPPSKSGGSSISPMNFFKGRNG